MSETTASDPVLDLRTLPKVSLHDHLDGGLRAATVAEISAQIGHELPETEPEALADWFEEAADSGSLERYLETFVHTIAVMQTAEHLRRVAREYVEDLVADGVVYGEVRWAPEQHVLNGLSLDEAVEAVQAGLDEGAAAATETGRRIRVNQILSAMRQGSRSLEIAELALRHRHDGVVGFDLAGPEDGFPPSGHREALELVAGELFPTTLHAGEAAGLESIRSAIVDGRALRLGHGVRLAEDLEVQEPDDDGEVEVVLGQLAAWVRDRGIALEVCPSSNLQTGAAAAWGEGIETHPVDVLFRTGFAVTIATDNRLMSRTTLSDELALLVATFDYDVEDLLDLTLNAVDAAFLDADERAALGELVLQGYEDAVQEAAGA